MSRSSGPEKPSFSSSQVCFFIIIFICFHIPVLWLHQLKHYDSCAYVTAVGKVSLEPRQKVVALVCEIKLNHKSGLVQAPVKKGDRSVCVYLSCSAIRSAYLLRPRWSHLSCSTWMTCIRPRLSTSLFPRTDLHILVPWLHAWPLFSLF